MAIQIVRNGYMPILETGSWKPAEVRAPGRISLPSAEGEAGQSAQLVALLRAIIAADQEFSTDLHGDQSPGVSPADGS